MKTVDEILKLFKAAKSRRSQWEDLWEEIYELMLPMQEGFFGSSLGEENMELIYDETAVVSIQQFAATLQSQLVPNFSNWFRLIPGTEIDKRQARKLQGELDDVTKFTMEIVHNSNFSQASVESFLDLAVGTGNMLIQDDLVNGKVIDYQAISQPSIYILPGPGGTIDKIFRVHNLEHIKDAKTLWPKATFSDTTKKKFDQDKAKCTVIESVMRDWKKLGDTTWDYDVVIQKEKDKIFSDTFKGEGSSPWVNYRWSNRPGEVFGRGPAVLALPAARVANLITKLTMENADIQIGGMWQVDDDGTVNVDTIEIASGTVIPRTPGSGGMESISPGGNLQFGDLLLSRSQEHIRDIFFNLNVGDLNKTPRPANEVDMRGGNLAQRMGSSYGRLYYEFVTPVVQRTLFLLKKAGKIEIPKINGREVQVVSTSPLARGMKIDRIQNITGFYSTVAQTLGPQRASLFIKDKELVDELAENFEVPGEMLTTKEERAQAAAQLGQAAAQAEETAPGGAEQLLGAAGTMASGG